MFVDLKNYECGAIYFQLLTLSLACWARSGKTHEMTIITDYSLSFKETETAFDSRKIY